MSDKGMALSRTVKYIFIKLFFDDILILVAFNPYFQALAINETWLSRCDHGQLFTGDFFRSGDIPYSTIFAGIPDSYYNLFYKSRFAFHYIYHYISKNFDWYMKVSS